MRTSIQMSSFRKLAFVAYLLSACGLILGGILYLTRSEFMPYHREAVGMPWQAVPSHSRVLFLALIHFAGALAVSLGCAAVALIAFPFRRAEGWADWIVPIVLLISEFAGLRVSLEVAAQTGAHTPWPVALAGVLSTAAGIAFCCAARMRNR